MKNLFKKGFASLALASAMTSGAFAGNAAYIDVKINYLSGNGAVTIGSNGTPTDDKNAKVELLVTVLDKDGAYATKNKDGSSNIGDLTLADEETNVGKTNTNALTISRALESDKNIRRFILDYSSATSKELVDEITLTSGKLERKVNVMLASEDGEGLVLRATPNGDIDKSNNYINELFADINVTKTEKLSVQSNKAPGGLAGVSIPVQIYAAAKTVSSLPVNGRFTYAPNLEGKTIVVQALADYNASGTANVALNSIEVVMKHGQASGTIVIKNALDSPGHSNFESALNKGLGIVFLAYVKDEQKINNYGTSIDNTTDLNDFTFAMAGNVASSDSIQVYSGEPAKLKIGTFDPAATKLSKLWTNTSKDIIIADGSDTTTTKDVSVVDISNVASSKVLTVVDMYDNPVLMTVTEAAKTDLDSKVVSIGIASNTVVNASPVSTVTVTATDSADTNNTTSIKTVNFTVDASNGLLSSIPTVELTAKTLPLIEYAIDGGSELKKSISDVNTTAAFAAPENFPLIATATNVLDVRQNDFTVVIKTGLGDTNTGDENSTLRVYIKDKSGESDSGYLEGADLTKYTIVANGSSTVIFAEGTNKQPVFDGVSGTYDGTALTSTTRIDKINDGYVRFDFTSEDAFMAAADTAVAAKDVNFTITISAGSNEIAKIALENYNANTTGESEVEIKIPVFEDKSINAYVEVYVDGEVDLKEVTPGTVVNFKFSGAAVSVGDKVEIDMNATSAISRLETVGRIGLVGSDIDDNTDGLVEATLPENGIVSVVLYDANATDKAMYGFNTNAVKINGLKPVWAFFKDNGDTDDIKELNTSDTFIMKRLDDNAIAKVSIAVTTTDGGDGSADDKREKLPELEMASTKAITLADETVLTGLYYDIFVAQADVTLLDKYGNAIDGLKNDIKKDIEFTATSGIEFDNDGTDSWVKFKDEAAGTEQTLTLSYTKDDGKKVSNTITWSDIKLSKTNSGFVITTDANGMMDANTGTFNVANSEVVIKVIGNGNQKQSSTKITLTHTDKDAKLRLVKLADAGTDSYDNVLSGLTSSISDVIASTGNYYIVSADKAGTLTIKVDSTVKDAKDNDVAITATHTVMFKAIDITKPVVEGSDVVASKGSITTMIKDVNLNTKTTKVMIKDINGKVVKEAVYTDGKYVASGLTSGLYQVWIFAADMAGNKQEFNYTRTVGKGAATVEETAAITLIAKRKYTVAGTFSSYDFKDVDSSKDWIYTAKDGKVYQLLGNASTDKDVFGWKEVKDIKATDTNVWYMVNTGKGKFDWALANKDGLAYKLSGVKADGTFKFSGRLYLNAKYSDNTLTFTAK